MSHAIDESAVHKFSRLCRKRFFMFDPSQRRPVEKMAAHSGHL